MTRALSVALLLLFFLSSGPSMAEEDAHLHAAMRVIAAFEVKPLEERGLDIADLLIQAGIAPRDSRENLGAKFAEMLGSEKYLVALARVYMEKFTTDELDGIAKSLENESFRRFLALRFEIQAASMGIVEELMAEFGVLEEIQEQ